MPSPSPQPNNCSFHIDHEGYRLIAWSSLVSHYCLAEARQVRWPHILSGHDSMVRNRDNVTIVPVFPSELKAFLEISRVIRIVVAAQEWGVPLEV